MKPFDKIIGYESVKKELYQIIDMFKNRELYEKMGAKLPKGLLLYGAPGMGKSLLANALIEECNVKTFILKKNKNSNDTINEIAETFENAAKEDLSIVLIDDIDKFSDSSDDDVDDESFVAIQSGIDSVKTKNVLVVATANNYKKLPDSLKRSGRFDIKIRLQSPTNEDARKIIEFYMKDKCVDKNINYGDISKMITYTSCADLEALLNDGAISAVYNRKECIDINDILNSYLKKQYGLFEDNDLFCNNDNIDAVALHEAGHAVIAEVIKDGCVGFISVQAGNRNGREGFTHICEDFTRRPENILVGLGGKMAVELYLEGRCGSGCQSDIARVVTMLRDGISDSGTCGIGMIDVYGIRNEKSSEAYKEKCENVTQAELERYMFMAKDILIKNKDFLFALADKLKENKNLFYSDIRKIKSSVKITETYIP